VIQELLGQVTEEGKTLFYASMVAENTPLSLALLKLGADPTLHEIDFYPLVEACKRIEYDLAMQLLDHPEIRLSSEENEGVLGETLLAPITSISDRKTIERMAIQLIDMGANLTHKIEATIKGKQEMLTPLELALERSYPQVAIHLLSHNQDLLSSSFADGPHCTLLHRAVENDDVDFIKFLLAFRHTVVDRMIEMTDEEGQTVLHAAARNRNSLAVTYLLDDPRVRALINKQDLQGQTALHYAVLCNNIDLYRHLQSLGADPNITNIECESALSLSISMGLDS